MHLSTCKQPSDNDLECPSMLNHLECRQWQVYGQWQCHHHSPFQDHQILPKEISRKANNTYPVETSWAEGMGHFTLIRDASVGNSVRKIMGEVNIVEISRLVVTVEGVIHDESHHPSVVISG